MIRISIVLLTTILLGCQSSSTDLVKVWPTEESGVVLKKYGPSIREARTPSGFAVAPADVSEMCSPRKYQIAIYADGMNYYVAKVTASSSEVKQYGECVNGKTGEIRHPKQKNQHSILHISPYKEISNN
jgi:hypothetical protein